MDITRVALFDRVMAIGLSTPDVEDLPEVLDALRRMQREGDPVQLHPGDVGWSWRFGAADTAATLRTWNRDGSLAAVGMLDGPTLLRLAIVPEAEHDEELARAVTADLVAPSSGVLPEGSVSVEVRVGEALRRSLAAQKWVLDEPWTPLHRDLGPEVEDCGLRIEVTTPDRAPVRTAVHRAAFARSTFTDERWAIMAAGPAYSDARCLVGYDPDDVAVAGVTVWSAGAGRPGLLEPMGAHPDHRRRGYGRAITVAAAAALRELGSSSATVCTVSANVAGVAAYVSAGFTALPEVQDLRREI